MMTRESLPSAWSVARWAVLGVALPLALWACVSHPLAQPYPQPVQETVAQVTIVPMRRLDLVFMVDNSPSMGPKQDKMKEQFPKLVEALRDPVEGTLPDLRIAILDSDLGDALSGRCTKSSATYGDRGTFQMRDAVGCGANADARWLEYTKNQPINFSGELSEVFGCLASNLGVEGCGFEHQLGALEWAFYLEENQSQWDFLRPEAYLGIVILTDEDDCSAPPGTGMFAKWERPEAWSLRCATRAHTCDGVTLGYPSTGALSVPYASCRARGDETCADDVDTSQATSCNPLLKISRLADSVKQLKGGAEAAEEKILVAGIYGTPREGEAASAVYKIDLTPDPTPGAASDAKIWDYWPICYDPNFPPAASGFDQRAAEHGATGGLRIDAFLDEFSENRRLKYSICEPDFGPAMKGIGDALTVMMGDLCVPFKLVDTSEEPGLQADCRVAYRIPRAVEDEHGKATLVFDEKAESLPACDATRAPDCWEVIPGKADGGELEKRAWESCPAKDGRLSQMVNVVRKPGDDLPVGTKAVMQCLTCVDLPPGIQPPKGCE